MKHRNAPFRFATLLLLLQAPFAQAETTGAAPFLASGFSSTGAGTTAQQTSATGRLNGNDLEIGTEIGSNGRHDAVLLSVPSADNAGARQGIGSGGLWATLGGSDIHGLIEAAAVLNDIPVWFFVRLIRQESGFNPQAVSPVGALGIAQFMPATAAERGLANPLDPVQAIPKSAELLRELKDRFGNLGLAAAAYNAGAQRVQSWLAGRGDLPSETRAYVLAITGRPVQDWAPRDSLAASADTPPPSDGKPILIASKAPSLFAEKIAGAPAAAGPQDRRLSILLEVEARQHQASRRQRQAKAGGEQSLCSLMNSIGSTCIVQKMY